MPRVIQMMLAPLCSLAVEVLSITLARPLQAQRAEQLLPRPARVVTPADVAPLTLSSPVRIVIPANAPRLADLAALLASELRERTGLASVVAHAGGRGAIRIDVALSAADSEAYALTTGESGASIHGASVTGALWGVQTLLQLIDSAPAPAAAPRAPVRAWSVPAVRIDDAPRFGWRGTLVDVGRHYLPVRDIERHIDLLSRFKLNVLHWHLTEDQGWRLEIKRYPRLTSVGAWRREGDGSRYGGFYTQAQARHLVAYARRRGVTIVPEIEMPGHSSAALAAYPSLGCTSDTIAVAASWGVFADIYCAGKEETFTFLFGVLDEVMDVFPSPVIHIGGDEAPKDRWTHCAPCQAVMQREGLANEEALQSWFMGRIAAHVAKRGRRVIGWDEVLDGPYIAGGMVQSWRDSSFTRKAVTRGHDVVASPGEFTYIDRPPNDLTVAGVYRFEPVPPGLTAEQAARVRGGEAPLWSERITSGANLELMALPRLLAFAEVMWSAAPRDLAGLERRLAERQIPVLRAAGYAVGPSDAPIARFAVRYDSVARRAVLSLRGLAPGVQVRASTNGARPTAASPAVADGAPLGTALAPVIRLQPFWETSPILEELRLTLARHLGVGARVRTKPLPDRRYPGTGPWNLADGILGSSDHTDGLWQGWWGPDVEIVMELPAAVGADSVSVRFLQNVRSWIVMPSRVEFSFSADGTTWSEPVRRAHTVPVSREGAIIERFVAPWPLEARARFVRVVARSAGPLPPGHPGAGQPAWIFTDEVVVHAR